MIRLLKPLILLRGALAACAAGVLLAACGGGTSQVDPFVPDRYIAFGDELSAFTSDGRKWSINAYNSAGTAFDCTLHPLWIQSVAEIHDMKFAQCPAGTADAKAETVAVDGATVAGLKAQIDARAPAPFTEKVLVTVLVGMHDVKEIYDNRGSKTDAELLEEARQRGVDLAAQVNRLVGLGAKVIVSTAPDVGLTPWALSKGAVDAALLTELTLALNGRLRVNMLNDGRYVGLVLLDEQTQTAVRYPSLFGLSDGNGVKQAACAVALPDCSPLTLVTGASADNWMWADELRFGIAMHRNLGSLAAARARYNPF